MPFSVLIIEKDLSTRESLAELFREQFGEEDDWVITVGEATEFDITQLRKDQNLDLVVFKFPNKDFSQNDAFSALLNRSLFRALYFKETGKPLEDHMLSCHSGDIAVAIDEPDWDAWLARKAKVFLCSQLVKGGLDALFGTRDYGCLPSPYERRFGRRGSGLTHRLADLTRVIEAYWPFLDERTRIKVKKQFCVKIGQSRRDDSSEGSIWVTLRRQCAE